MEAAGQLTLAEARDLLGTSRRFAQALLEHMDSEGHDPAGGDTRRLRRRRATGAAGRRCHPFLARALAPPSEEREQPVGRVVPADEPGAARPQRSLRASGSPLIAITRQPGAFRPAPRRTPALSMVGSPSGRSQSRRTTSGGAFRMATRRLGQIARLDDIPLAHLLQE